MSHMLKALQNLERNKPAVAPVADVMAPPVQPSPAPPVMPPQTVPIQTPIPFHDSPFVPQPAAPAAPQLVKPTRTNLLWPSAERAPSPLAISVTPAHVAAVAPLAARVAEDMLVARSAWIVLASPRRMRESDFSLLALAAALAERNEGEVAVWSDRRIPGIRTGDSANSSLAFQTTLPRLSLLVADPADAPPALRDEMRATFRYILSEDAILDEGIAAAAASDGAYLVVCIGATRRGDAQTALDQLHAAGVRVLGCFVTAASADDRLRRANG